MEWCCFIEEWTSLALHVTASKRFKHLPKVAELVLVLPHSNADEERLFRMARKSKTESRA